MSTAQHCVSWLSFKDYISKGFSRLQQNGEFVDMTLAAEGHLVKVHQSIVALASPYLKAMIQSAPCQHPVVFLNNITQKMLCFILEYIYTGEVMIPTDLTPVFIETCKALHINGVENLHIPKKLVPETLLVKPEATVIERPEVPPDNNFAAHITIKCDNNVEVIPIENNTTEVNKQPLISLDSINLINYQPVTSASVVEIENNITQDNTLPLISLDDVEIINYQPPSTAAVVENNTENDNTFPTISMVVETDSQPPSDLIADVEANQNTIINSVQNVTCQNVQNMILDLTKKGTPPITLTCRTILPSRMGGKVPPSLGGKDKPLHYTVSNRGFMQLLLNRYLYYCHHVSCGGSKRRWRCVDYRKMRCPAIVDTDNENIVNGSEYHIHPYHDTKIMNKFKTKPVFSSISLAEEEAKKRIKEKNKVLTRKKRQRTSR